MFVCDCSLLHIGSVHNFNVLGLHSCSGVTKFTRKMFAMLFGELGCFPITDRLDICQFQIKCGARTMQIGGIFNIFCNPIDISVVKRYQF